MAADLRKDGYPPEIIGYAEPWIVAPGDSVAIKVRYLLCSTWSRIEFPR